MGGRGCGSRVTPAEDLGEGQSSRQVWRWGNGIHGELRLLTGMGRGVTGPERPMQTPTFPDTEQRLLQIQDKGRRQPRPGGGARVEAFVPF